MPTHPARARQLIKKKKAKIYKFHPLTIILTERNQGKIELIKCKIDPGSQTTGMALVVCKGKRKQKLFEVFI